VQHTSSHFNQNLVESFWNTIRLWTIWCNELLLNALYFAMASKSFRAKFTTFVTLDAFEIYLPKLFSTMAWNSLRLSKLLTFVLESRSKPFKCCHQ
jgi:hypothetical protein